MFRTALFGLLGFSFLNLLCASITSADALVVTRAMKASTIAEVFVNEDAVLVELEVGPDDILAFQNALPDDLYEKITGDAQPFDERVKTFLNEQWIVAADGEKLIGVIIESSLAKRLVRDETTGDPLAEQPADAEVVLRIQLRYAMAGRPKSVSFTPPQRAESESPSASIGFVAYHNGLAVNDFRYLSKEVLLELDWDDPWYSKFQHQNLRRQNAAPMLAYLYVEPFEVRKEIILRPKDLQHFIDLDLSGKQVIAISEQEQLKRRIAEFLSQQSTVLIDGEPANGELDRIHFVRRTLRRTGIVDPPEPMDVDSAMLGVIFVYPIESLPNEVSMRWELFNDKIEKVPSSASDEAGPLPSILTVQDPVLQWKNYLTNPTVPSFAQVAPPPATSRISIPIGTAICLALLVPLSLSNVRALRQNGMVAKASLIAWLVVVASAVLLAPFARVAVANPFVASPQLANEEASGVLRDLLHNVYRSFDRRGPSLIYDQLSRSIGGDLLEQVYLDTRRSIEVENQGGLQIKVKEVEILKLEPIVNHDREFTFRCRWRVAGSVGHWGHVHQRENEPSATITIAPIDEQWKIVGMEMLE